MRGDEHDPFGFHIKKVRHELINLWIGLVMANIFRRQNTIPGKTGVLRHVR